MRRLCSNCGLEIEGNEYYKCLDNFLQVNYFENDELNCFCSQQCFLDYVMLDTIEITEDEKNNEDSEE